MRIAAQRTFDHGAPAIALRGVVKCFGALRAVDGLDLEVPRGVCFGLLGPNGAGKSTTMRLLTGRAHADEGELYVLGHRLPQGSKAARLRSGVVPQEDNLDRELTVREILNVFARIYRVPRSRRRDAIERALETVSLADRIDTRVDTLSGGMRRRVLIARALVHDPDLILLDEPTVGLDPQVRQELWTVLDGLRERGVTVLMSTHYIEEAERLADTVAVMVGGRVVAQGPPHQLVRRHAGREAIEVRAARAQLNELELRAASSGWKTRRSGTSLVVLHAERVAAELPDGDRRPATLEDAFIVLTGHEVE